LLIILLYIIADFIPENNEDKGIFAYSIPIQEDIEIISSKNHFPSGDPKIIVERNIFGSLESNLAGLDTRRDQIGGQIGDPTVITGGQFRLRATIAGDDQIACAVIENLKSKVQDIYKTGDVIEGAKIESIGRNKIVLCYGEQREVLNMLIASEVSGSVEKNKEPVMAHKHKTAGFVDAVSPVKRNIVQKDYTTQVPGMEVFLEKMEIIPYVVDGEGRGLSITGLDNLSMAGFFGFENGDVIQTINGQMLTDKQKAFQVLKKARSQSSINLQLLRNEQKMDLSFDIK